MFALTQPFRSTTLLACTLGIMASGTMSQARSHHHASGTGARPVVLTQQPGSGLDQAARALNASDLAAATSKGDKPVVLVGSAPLAASGKGDIAMFVQIQSARLCGSAGCLTSIYRGHRDHWVKILDSVSGTISVLPSNHGGMHDLLVGKNDPWVWDGSTYRDTLSAPSIGDLRQSVRAHQAARKSQ